MHRFLFHIDMWLPDHSFGLTLHFSLHGIHHYLLMDRYRLSVPPPLFVVLVAPFWALTQIVFFYNWYDAVQVFSSCVFGYVWYDMNHYFFHHHKYVPRPDLPFKSDLVIPRVPKYYKQLKKNHLRHHYADCYHGFGITSQLWDFVCGTELENSSN